MPMVHSLKHSLRLTVLALARPAILFYALPWLMFLLVAGTIAQRYLGLYQSEKLFFGSFIFWLGPLPLPGAYTTLAMMAVCVSAKLILKSPWKKQQAGIILTHVSVLMLLVGALVTALTREEGYIVLGKDQQSNKVSDYHLRELAILKNGALIATMPQEALVAGTQTQDHNLPFALTVDSYARHAVLQARKTANTKGRGLAEKLEIVPAPARVEDAENQAALAFSITGLSAQENGAYIASEALSQSPVVQVGKDRYEFLLRHAERSLPFSLQLMEFEKSDYPGTQMARSYRSHVSVKEGELSWNDMIEMNQPLRHAGYTVYQSSFVEDNGQLLTVLAVVKNTGAIFPYLAVLFLCGGLLLQVVIKSMMQVKR